MKIRNGFVSNSSSSSFVIIKQELTEEQIKALIDYNGSDDNIDAWDITEDDKFITGFTVMDNEGIGDFLKKIQIPDNIIRFHY